MRGVRAGGAADVGLLMVPVGLGRAHGVARGGTAASGILAQAGRSWRSLPTTGMDGCSPRSAASRSAAVCW